MGQIKANTQAPDHLNGTDPTQKFSSHADAPKSSGLAIYIHVPFCRQRCAYCHFEIKVLHPRTDPRSMQRIYQEAVVAELEFYGVLHGARAVSSIFFGGGTPSRLTAADLGHILAAVDQHFTRRPDCEISIEVNPEDAPAPYLHDLLSLGFNRISFGVQSFQDESLRAIQRVHDGATARRRIAACPLFPRGRSLDLMLGLPYQTETSLRRDLAVVAELGTEHLSVYMLERDLPTPLDKLAASLPMPDEDRQADFYQLTCEVLTGLGLEAYEISNFAREGYTCRHNLTYWTGGDYLGIGPAAHGRIGLNYRANHPQLGVYAKAVANQGHGGSWQEIWSAARLRQEQIIGGLRLREGIDTSLLVENEKLRLQEFAAMDLVWKRESRTGLTPRGRLLANEIFEVFV